ncbi:hypothetical protein B0T24DRAFT_380534 [Lasiosphaeria ovina]|uniref:Uncharacterized protein n=1 Tax=Lasiosphaeria ovina TaxID=92902 RepID=A0AAE0JZW6_9PEZI|nr:hypothetical protein B0T24DRAFT_380534 [Lasiosphaeria ovina]
MDTNGSNQSSMMNGRIYWGHTTTTGTKRGEAGFLHLRKSHIPLTGTRAPYIGGTQQHRRHNLAQKKANLVIPDLTTGGQRGRKGIYASRITCPGISHEFYHACTASFHGRGYKYLILLGIWLSFSFWPACLGGGMMKSGRRWHWLCLKTF